MTFSEYRRHQGLWDSLFFGLFILLNSTVNATSVLMESERAGRALAWWEPFLWEYSSALSFVLLLPLIIAFDKRYPLGWGKWLSSGWRHLLFSVLVSVLHVTFMFSIRYGVYWLVDGRYDMGAVSWVFVYEYRIDLITYLLILAILYAYRFVIGRLSGEAAFVGEGEESEARVSERFLVKKLGKEFVIQLKDVDWMESAGNYVNLHVKDRVYPVRTTMAQMEADVSERAFCRIHRSILVNLARIAHLETLESGDGTVTLVTGQTLKMSRRYRVQLKACMN
ncbi:LytTR family DNA-binding domain-containing protein [Simiduia litorea]|uniref:LytR/AlgR family response regulator transcription factor n=1 Tax=Simiduia litorea TaxID=1435348 RepID=UPI0036F38535